MATLRELIIKISANSSSFQSEIARASRMGSDYYRVMQNGGRQAAIAAKESENALKDLTAGFASAGRAATVAAAAFATGGLIKVADEWNSVNARLKQATISTNDFTVAQSQLMKISQSTGTAFSDNANLFSRSAASMREFGYSTQEVLRVTEAVSTGLKLSGANTQESSSVITQFSQALAQGVLRGEEFNAVNESGDRVIRALAAGMGVARKDLKAMADAGKLTIDRVVPAIISQLGVMQSEFAAMPQTVSSSVQRVSNSFMAWVGGVNAATGATDTLSGGVNSIAGLLDSLSSSAVSGALNDVADNMSTITTAAGALVGVGLAKYFGGIVSGAASSTTSLIAAAKAEVSLASSTANAAQAAVTAARADVYRAQQALQRSKSVISLAAQEEKIAAAQGKVTLAQTRLNAALASGTATEKTRAKAALDRAQAALVSAKTTDAQTLAEKRLAAAQAGLNRNLANRSSAQQNLNSVTSVGTRMMSGALGLIGGIPGLVMLGAGAWYAMYQNQEQARASAIEYLGALEQVKAAASKMSLPELDDNRGKTISALQEQNRLVSVQEKEVARLKAQIEDLNNTRGKPGLTSENDENIVRAVTVVTSQLAVEEEKLYQLREKSAAGKKALGDIERFRNEAIREQVWRQNQQYQSLLLMNGQFFEYNRLLSAGNTLLAARQSLVNIPMRIPNATLTDKQADMLKQSDQQLELAGLKGEARAKRQAEFAADAAGLTDTPEYADSRNRYISNEVNRFRKDEAAKPEKKGPKTEGEKTEDVYKRLIKQQQEQIALAGTYTELAKMKYQVTQGELASLEKAKKETLIQNAALIDQKDIAEQLKTFRDGLADTNDAARNRGNIDFLGAGMGDKARDRMKEMADIRTDFTRQQNELQRDFSRGQISEDLYRKQTEALKEALDERLEIQKDYYKKSDKQQSDWRSGVTDALMNYADQAADLSSVAATATSEILNNTTSSIASNMTSVLTGTQTFKEGMSGIFTSLGETVIQTMIQMAMQALITRAIMASFGGGGGLFGSLFGGASSAASGAGAMGMSTSFAAYANAKGGVYDSPSLSSYSGGVYSTPQYFAFAKGAGVFGEAGPEAIMPLTRGADGSLGVRAIGRQSAAVEAAAQQIESQPRVTVHVSAPNTFTGKPDDATLLAIDKRTEALGRRLVDSLTSEVMKPQNKFGRAIYSNLQSKKPT
ncbi:phage tail tape measure protein [Pantoea coffeiphila]|uniref:Phage tail tape measure protein n=1 Tax=Pantoea coffeiphila TaxID=1465635 RepID=A0A2S9I486_9GAMM|nr:phage tail tape measure protein [Pantoea coffeiphila]PRD12581.1 phage tail tape measure protein [Pantoea coffeiphila]